MDTYELFIQKYTTKNKAIDFSNISFNTYMFTRTERIHIGFILVIYIL